MSTLKETYLNQNQKLSNYVIHTASAVLQKWRISIINFIFAADTNSDNTTLLINN